MPQSTIDDAFARVRAAAIAAALPGIEEGTSYGTPALLVRKKSICRMKDEATLVLMCALEEKEMLMEAAPSVYFETDHYKGWPAVLVRLAEITDEELGHRLTIAWRERAGKRLVSQFEASR